MAKHGDALEGVASSIEFVETTVQSGGERIVVEINYHGTGDRPPEHFHPSQTERFEVLEGEVHAIVGGSERILRSGDRLEIPPGTPHEMWADQPARQRWETAPALRTEQFFETFWGLQNDGHAGEDGMPSLPQTALTLRHFSDEIRLTSPPAAVQAIAFPLLASLGRARGLEPVYVPQR